MSDEDRKRHIDAMLFAFLEAQARERADGITLRVLANHVDEVRRESVENRIWRGEHEEKDDARHHEMQRRLDRIEERVEEKLESVTDDFEELAEKTGKYQVMALEKPTRV